MDYFEINGRKSLHGEVKISGDKNAVLPLMAAAILNNKKLQILNVPFLSKNYLNRFKSEINQIDK